jgi:hypothetical protein
VGQADPSRVRRESAPPMRSCAGRSIPKGAVRHREPPPPRRRRPWKARPSKSTRPQPTSRHPNDAPRGASVQAGLQTGNGEQPKPQQCALRRATAARPRSSTAPSIQYRSVRESAPRSRSHCDTRAVANRFELCSKRSASDSLDCSLSTRAAEVESVGVNAAAKTLSRPRIWMASGRCAPPLGETVETSIASASGLRAHRQPRQTRQASRHGHDRPRGGGCGPPAALRSAAARAWQDLPGLT